MCEHNTPLVYDEETGGLECQDCLREAAARMNREQVTPRAVLPYGQLNLKQFEKRRVI